MFLFVGLTVGLLVGLAFAVGYAKRDEVKANWSQYHADLLYMIAAPMFKPDDDPRSPAQFAADNFSDVIAEKVQQLFAVLMEPIYKIFGLVTSLLVDTLNGLFNIKSLLGNMWKKWNSMTDIFTRRYHAVFNELRMTFQRLNMAIGRVFGVATASIYSALSVIDGIRSFIDLMVIVVLVILGILIAMIFFLWFVLFPSIPLILTVIAIVVAAGGSAAAGMSDSFCFKQGTMVATAAGPVPIEKVTLGTELATGGHVKGVMEFAEANYDLYDLYGVQVSGSHIVYADDTPIHVCDHTFAYPTVHGVPTKVYCLVTSDQKIPVVTPRNGIVMFADWEELESDADLRVWHRMVQEMLNGGGADEIPEHALTSEAVFSERTRIWTPVGVAEIRGIRPGDTVIDADGKPTRVTGVVKMSSGAVLLAEQIGHDAHVSAGAWIRTAPGAQWHNPTHAVATATMTTVTWHSLFTETGTFKICEDICTECSARDFSDVGSDKIQTSYGWVLEALKSVA